MNYIEKRGPVIEPITLEEAKNLLGIDFDWKDEEIRQLIAAARERAESYTGLALVQKKIEVYFDATVFSFEAPCPPLISLERVAAFSVEGEEKEIPVSSYHVFPMDFEPGIVEARYEDIYPENLRRRRAITFEIRAGYKPDTCPAALKDAIKFYIQSTYCGAPFAEWQGSFHALLAPWSRVNI